jgi:hypothetical protein
VSEGRIIAVKTLLSPGCRSQSRIYFASDYAKNSPQKIIHLQSRRQLPRASSDKTHGAIGGWTCGIGDASQTVKVTLRELNLALSAAPFSFVQSVYISIFCIVTSLQFCTSKTVDHGLCHADATRASGRRKPSTTHNHLLSSLDLVLSCLSTV